MEKLQNYFTLANKCRAIITDEEGNIIRSVENTNITCNAGRQNLALRIMDDGSTTDLGIAKYIAIGDDNTPATITDTILGNEIVRASIDPVLASNTGTTVKVYARFPVGFAVTAEEAGLFIGQNATAFLGSGALLARSIFPVPVVKNTNEVLTIEWEINVINATI